MLATQDQTSNRMSFAIIIAALIIGSALIVISEIPPLVYGISLIGIIGYMVAAIMGIWLLVGVAQTVNPAFLTDLDGPRYTRDYPPLRAIITEVNAIGTAFLRADLLSEPGRTDVQQRLYEYAQSRYVEPGSITTLEETEKVVARSEEIQSLIWPATRTAIRQDSRTRTPARYGEPDPPSP